MKHEHGYEVQTTEEQKIALEKLHDQVTTAQMAYFEASMLLKQARENFWENASEMGLIDDDWQYVWEPKGRKMICLGLSNGGIKSRNKGKE